MDIVHEIDVTNQQHQAITKVRNQAFPEHQVPRSYYKQLPHMRALEYKNGELIGYLGLDYRVMKVADTVYTVLGIIDFCVAKPYRSQGVGSAMLAEVAAFAEKKNVDFITLISEHHQFYCARGYQQVSAINSWLRVDEHTNYGVAVEFLDQLYVKPISGREWECGHVEWLGYMY
ncbi:GNAT family N-acetyltransferase [Vibrio rarus]|uniref:GNAT family N-acetyltransferase n=1 Tax=Vibrio rarus TaxID=413403 RepID=UPI0021C43FF4|nr:GNAT family N-acetyltransferase [Vibrio rarus]